MCDGEADHVADYKAQLRVDENRLAECPARRTKRADSVMRSISTLSRSVDSGGSGEGSGKQALRLAGRASCHARR